MPNVTNQLDKDDRYRTVKHKLLVLLSVPASIQIHDDVHRHGNNIALTEPKYCAIRRRIISVRKFVLTNLDAGRTITDSFTVYPTLGTGCMTV